MCDICNTIVPTQLILISSASKNLKLAMDFMKKLDTMVKNNLRWCVTWVAKTSYSIQDHPSLRRTISVSYNYDHHFLISSKL